MSEFRYVVSASTRHESGKFVSVDEIEEKLGEALDEVESAFSGDLQGSVGPDGDSYVEVESFSVEAEDLCDARRKGKPGSCVLAPGHYGEHVSRTGVERWANRGRSAYGPAESVAPEREDVDPNPREETP